MILLYSKKCIPCFLLKNELKKLGIKFKEIDVESEEGRKLVKKLGIKGVPAIIDNEKVIMFGYNKEKIKEILKNKLI